MFGFPIGIMKQVGLRMTKFYATNKAEPPSLHRISNLRMNVPNVGFLHTCPLPKSIMHTMSTLVLNEYSYRL